MQKRSPSRAETSTTYFLGDNIGTTQYEVSSGGWPIYAGQFSAWGQELAQPIPPAQVGAFIGEQAPENFKFTGKERDPETGNDYFGARYYTSGVGRFMSPDWSAQVEPVPYSKLDDPQTLNLYAYVGNNPISSLDLDGHQRDPPPPDPQCQGREDPHNCDAPGNAQRDSNDAQKAQQTMSSPGAPAATGSQPMIQGVAANGTYSSKKAAALAAERAGIGDTRGAAKGGKYEEFGGWIISKDGRYTYTNPVTFGDPQHFFADNVTVPGGYTAVGGYHTHPGLVASVEDAFSPQDAAWANGHGKPAYLGVAVNGNVRVYNPGQPYDRWLGTPGTLIGNVP